ncbi:MAG: glycoside hydrolase family 5 protein [Lachnospiraceae bacterium]|nr:glycoside hydrolase family 5 protein [Lachnospiraceae bacterium]
MKKSFIKRIASGLMAGILAFAMAASTATLSSAVHAEAAGTELTGKTAMEITEMMGKGYNIGNTLDATGGSMSNIEAHETSWGNPTINQELMHGIKEAGFKSVRIPITWYKHISKSDNYAISEEFKARVKEVVDMAYAEDLFVIINVHHEAWVNRSDFDTAYPEIGEELQAVWEQIADLFADYDQHLIFEGMNEPRAEGTAHEWTGYQECYDAIAYLDQLFVETVRANGKGHNNERMLMIPGYAASSSANVLKSIVIPTIDGEEATNVAISVHCYSPYNFCLTDNQTTFDPTNSADTADIKQLMSNINAFFLTKGIPVVIGECGCTNSGNNTAARAAWFTYFGETTAEYGVPAIVWDNGAGGSSGGECHKYFERRTGEPVALELIQAFVGDTELRDTVIDFESVVEGGTTTLCSPTKEGFTSSTLNCAFNVNHTPDVEMGFALKVQSSEDDFTALLNISKYAGIPVRVTAWLRTANPDQVSVGYQDNKVTEMEVVETGDEWIRVSFVVTPSEDLKTYVYFKGNNETFYVDDITVSMDTTDLEADDAVQETEGNSDAGQTAPADPTEAKGVSPVVIVLIVCGVVAIVAVCVIVVSSKKNKK